MPQPHLDIAALYAALDQKRRSLTISWRQLAGDAGVSPSTLTRMAQNKRPDVDSFTALVKWLGVPAESFMRGGVERERQGSEEPYAVVSSYLRARKELSPESAAALENIIRAAYEALRTSK